VPTCAAEQGSWIVRFQNRVFAVVLFLSAVYHLVWECPLTGEPSQIAAFFGAFVLVPLGLLAEYRWRDRLRELIRGVLQAATPSRIVLLALVIRLVWVLASDNVPTADYAIYQEMAEEILDGEYVLHTYKPTGASLLFAGHYRILGMVPLWPRVTIALLSVSQVLAIFLLARRTTGSEAVARFAALLLAVWPEHWLYTNLLGSDVLFSSFLTWSFACLAIAGHGPVRATLLGSAAPGVLIGISQWMRPSAPLFLLAVLAFKVLVPGEPLRRRALGACAVLAGFLAAVLPIALLNERMTGKPSFSPSSTLGWSLFVGANPVKKGYTNRSDDRVLQSRLAEETSEPGEHPGVFRDRILHQLYRERLRDHPWRTLALYATHKPWRLWSRPARSREAVKFSRFEALSPAVETGSRTWHLHMLLLAAAVLWRAARRGAARWSAEGAFTIAALLTTAAHVLLEVQSRYHHMFVPLLALIVAQSLWSGARRRRLDGPAN
jgi:hypothetical protein